MCRLWYLGYRKRRKSKLRRKRKIIPKDSDRTFQEWWSFLLVDKISLPRDGITRSLLERFFFSFSDTRQVTLLSDLEGKQLRRSIWHLHETCVRYFSNFRYTEITIHILVNISCLEVIVLISNRCVSTEAFRRKGECKKKFFVCSFLLNNRRLSVRALGNLWYNNNFTHSSAHRISLIAPWFFHGTSTVIVKWDYTIHIYTFLHSVFCIQKIPFFYLFSDFNRWYFFLF